jgi:hydroxyacyl-ACP dehydratase HTD2-like protein with hotdog domain
MSKAHDNEKWLPVVECPNHYAVSNCGRVKRLARSKRSYPGFIPKSHLNRDGYSCFALCFDGIRKPRKIHRLVALSFIGPCPVGKEVNHKNGIKTDNRVENLEYVTRKENMKHRVRMGLFDYDKIRGEHNGHAKLTGSQVSDIRARYAAGRVTYNALARLFHVSNVQIKNIVLCRQWKRNLVGVFF